MQRWVTGAPRRAVQVCITHAALSPREQDRCRVSAAALLLARLSIASFDPVLRFVPYLKNASPTVSPVFALERPRFAPAVTCELYRFYCGLRSAVRKCTTIVAET
jgi:hypothetical protein